MKKILSLLFLFWTTFGFSQVRVGLEFGEPTLNCAGRGQLCQIRAIEPGQNYSSEGEGRLEIRGNNLKLFIEKSAVRGFLPNSYCDLKYPLEIPEELLAEFGLKATDKTIPPGRYGLLTEDKELLIMF